MAHAKLSPSSAERWMTCAASIVAQEGYEDKGSSYAQWGTDCHALAEAMLTGQAWECEDTEMVECAEDYVRQVLTLLEHDSVLLVEQRVDLSDVLGVHDSFGTSDAVVIQPSKRELQVHDLKAGKGVKVDAHENPQLMLYGLGALNGLEALYDIETVTLFIHQPRLNHVSEYSLSVSELKEFGEKARFAASRVISITKESVRHEDYQPTEKGCRFCKHAADCSALAAHVRIVTAEEFDDIDSTEPAQRLAKAYEQIPLVESWIKAVKAQVFTRLSSGQAVQGYKLVKGREGHRKWADEAKTLEAFRMTGISPAKWQTTKPISPAELDKLMKKEKLFAEHHLTHFKTLMTRSEGAPTIAPESDKRPPIENVNDAFDDLDFEDLM